MNKDTSEIVKELELSPDFHTFYETNKDYMLADTLAQLLNKLLETTGLKKSQVIRDAEISEVYGYQIFSGIRMPERKKLLSLAIAMHLDIPQTQLLLKKAGYSQLYVKQPFDSVVMYGLCKELCILQINEILYSYGLETLG